MTDIEALRNYADLVDTAGRLIHTDDGYNTKLRTENEKQLSHEHWARSELISRALRAYASILELKGLETIEGMLREQYEKLVEITRLVGLKKTDVLPYVNRRSLNDANL